MAELVWGLDGFGGAEIGIILDPAEYDVEKAAEEWGPDNGSDYIFDAATNTLSIYPGAVPAPEGKEEFETEEEAQLAAEDAEDDLLSTAEAVAL